MEKIQTVEIYDSEYFRQPIPPTSKKTATCVDGVDTRNMPKVKCEDRSPQKHCWKPSKVTLS